MQRFSIRDIENLTGIKAHTLRIWEQRYDLLRPKRTATNIRYYDDNDLKLLLNVSLLNKEGERISKIAQLSQDEINELVMDYASRNDEPDVHIQALISATLNLDESSFDRVFASNVKRTGLPRTMGEVIFPFLQKLGQLWMSGTVHPAYEHFISNIIRKKLILAADDKPQKIQKRSMKFLLFLPEGELHELGLLFANYLVKSRGHQSIFIGQGTPLDELEKIYLKFKPDYLFSSITMGRLPKPIREFSALLLEKFPGARLILTGHYAVSHKEKFPPTVIVVSSAEEFLKILG